MKQPRRSTVNSDLAGHDPRPDGCLFMALKSLFFNAVLFSFLSIRPEPGLLPTRSRVALGGVCRICDSVSGSRLLLDRPIGAGLGGRLLVGLTGGVRNNGIVMCGPPSGVTGRLSRGGSPGSGWGMRVQVLCFGAFAPVATDGRSPAVLILAVLASLAGLFLQNPCIRCHDLFTHITVPDPAAWPHCPIATYSRGLHRATAVGGQGYRTRSTDRSRSPDRLRSRSLDLELVRME